MEYLINAFVIICAIIVAFWFIARSVKLAILKGIARAKINIDKAAKARIADLTSRISGEKFELGSYVGLTTAEFIWNWAVIDPQLIQAADFAGTESIKNGFDFASYIHSNYDSLSVAGKEGFINRLTGYLGEQKVAAALDHAGHSVQIADTANQPVWDLVVDGHHANVKTIADTASIKADALAHHNVNYIVPSDVHSHTGGNIVPLEGFSHDSTKEAVKDGISAAHGENALHGLGFHLPFITIGIAAYRNYKQVKDHGKDPGVAFNHTIVESIGRGTGVVLGAKAGALVGSVGGPVGMLVGAVITGTIGAIFGGSLAEKWKRKSLDNAVTNLDYALDQYGRSFRPRINAIKETVKSPVKRMETACSRLNDEVRRRTMNLRYILWPDSYTVLLSEAAKTGFGVLRAETDKVKDALSTIDNINSQGEWEKLGAYMANSPDLSRKVGYDPRLLDSVMSARRSVLRERRNLNPELDLPD